MYMCIHIYIYIYIHIYVFVLVGEAVAVAGRGGQRSAAGGGLLPQREPDMIIMSITSHTGMHFLGVSWYSLVTRGTRCAQ